MTKNKTQKLINKKNIKNKKGAGFFNRFKKTTVQQPPINNSFVGTPNNPTNPKYEPKSVKNTVVNWPPKPLTQQPQTTLQQPTTTLQQTPLPQTTETKKSWFHWGKKKEENKGQSQIKYYNGAQNEISRRINKPIQSIQSIKPKQSFFSSLFKPQSLPIKQNQPDQTFEIYWVRHANSCANMLESYGGKGIKDFMYSVTHLSAKTKRGTYTPDPHITNFGISHANYISKQSFMQEIEPDIICVSQLLRTWETAYTLFPHYFYKSEKELYVCPWINEKRENMFGTNLDNEPDLPENTIRKFNEFKKYLVKTFAGTFKESLLTKINYINRDGNGLLHTQINQQDFIENYKTPQPDYNKFIEKILPYLYDHILQNKPNAKIVIVTHSKFIQKNITKVKDKNFPTVQCVSTRILEENNMKITYSGYPRNCDIYKQTYNAKKEPNKKKILINLKKVDKNGKIINKNKNKEESFLAVQVNPPSLDQNFDKFELLPFINPFKRTNNNILNELKENCYQFFTQEMVFDVDSKENINSLLIQAVAKIIRIIDNNNQENMINKNKYIKYLFFKLKNFSVNPKMQVIEHAENFMQRLENSKNFQSGVNSNNVNFNIYKNLIDFIMNNQIFWNISLGLCNDKDKSYQNNVIKYFKSHPELYKKIINKIKENVYGKTPGLEPSNNPIIMNKLLYDILTKLNNDNNDLFIRFNRSESINNRINNQQILQTPQKQPVNNFRNIIGVEPATEVTEIREVVEQPRSNNNKIAGKIIYYKDLEDYSGYKQLVKRYYYKRNKPSDVFFYLDKRSFDRENYPLPFTNPSIPKHNLNTSSIVNEVILEGNIKTIDDFIKNKNTSRNIELNNLTPRIVPIENVNEI